MKEEVIAKGRLFELVHETQPDGRIFEIARRAPGVRLIIANKEKKEILLTKEFRRELQDWDYRLPGGKVFDSLDDYERFRRSGEDILIPARKKAVEESTEEAGIRVDELEEFRRSTLGATVEWDLFVFEAKVWQASEEGQQLEDGEIIEADNWFTYEKVSEKILNGEMREERIALIVLQWIHQQEKEAK